MKVCHWKIIGKKSSQSNQNALLKIDKKCTTNRINWTMPVISGNSTHLNLLLLLIVKKSFSSQSFKSNWSTTWNICFRFPYKASYSRVIALFLPYQLNHFVSNCSMHFFHSTISDFSITCPCWTSCSHRSSYTIILRLWRCAGIVMSCWLWCLNYSRRF